MKSRIRWLAVTAGALALAGCVVAPGRPYYGEPVTVAPPAPRVEVVGVAPSPGYIWIGGYWGWYGGRHQWVPGYWAPPRPGYRWAPHRWDNDGPYWQERRGYWERER